MIHLKSTLAISAIMLAGLVAASPFPYSSDPDALKPRRPHAMQPVSAAEAATTPVAVAWADPPVKAAAPVEQPAVLASAATAAEPLAVIPAQVRQVTPQAHVTPQAKAEQARRRKIARAATRQRQAASRQAAPQGSGAPETQVANGTTQNSGSRIDPIGDILRGLGLGKQG
ncbi:hypothetical protein GGR33_001653 [Methylobacterium brachythecii]|nr:hypothetical protein [Methylobacterium brachythecii]MBB3902158.1 hypothetical protein [Methylobacterium brachythecii]